jgi:phage terminase large subunit-like protein
MRFPPALLRDYEKKIHIPTGLDPDNLPDINSPETAARYISLFEKFFWIPADSVGGLKKGTPFRLIKWQFLTAWRLFGTLRTDGTRQYRECLIYIPKKNGKSPFFGACSVIFAAFDGDSEAVVVNVSNDRKQAGKMYEPIVFNVTHHPLLKKRFKVFRSEHKIKYYHPNGINNGTIIRATGDAKFQQGEGPSAVMLDEIAEMLGINGRALFDTHTKFTQGARRNPIIMMATTALTWEEGSVVNDQVRIGKEAMADPERHPAFLPIMYMPTDKQAEALRKKIWPSDELILAVNPAIGEILDLEREKEELKKAFDSPTLSDWQNALCKRFNVFVNSTSVWMPPEIWNVCDFGPVDPDSLVGRDCYCGIDIGGTEDLTAAVWIFPPAEPGEKIKIICKSYLPADRISLHSKQTASEPGKPVRREDAKYTEWRDAGWLTETPGKISDTAFMVRDIVEFAEKFNVIQHAFDPYAASLMRRDLEEGHGITNLVPIQNTPRYFNEVLDKCMAEAVLGHISHEGNPVLAWCMSNLTVISNADGHLKPYKGDQNRANRNDAAIAFLTAWAAWMAESNPWAGANGENLGD